MDQSFQGSKWRGLGWPEGPRQEGIFVHRLGNLLLLPPGLNSELGDRDPVKKLDAYTQNGLLGAAEVAKTIRKGWGPEEVEEREKRLLKWIETT